MKKIVKLFCSRTKSESIFSVCFFLISFPFVVNVLISQSFPKSKRSLNTTKIHATLAHWTKRIQTLALAWSVHQHAVMWWNYRSKWTKMVKLSMRNSRHSDVDRLLRPVHWQRNGWRERLSTRRASWRTLTLLKNYHCHQWNCIVRVSYPNHRVYEVVPFIRFNLRKNDFSVGRRCY